MPRNIPRFALALTAALLAACSTGPESEPLPLPDAGPIADAVRQAQKDWPWIAGTRWELAAIEGVTPIEGSRIWIAFKPDETWVSGSSGCNRFTGSYIRRGEDGIRIGPLSSTRMFCNQPEGVMQQEARFLHLLGEAASYRATREWFHLLIDDKIVLSFWAANAGP
jgi:heat shock protein HslJ